MVEKKHEKRKALLADAVKCSKINECFNSKSEQQWEITCGIKLFCVSENVLIVERQ